MMGRESVSSERAGVDQKTVQPVATRPGSSTVQSMPPARSSSPSRLTSLQRSAGNRAVTRLMASRPTPSQPGLPVVQRAPTAAELDASFRQAVLDGQWRTAADALNGFNAADINTRLAGLSHAQRVSLYGAAPDWATPVLDGVARVDLPAAFDGALGRRAWTKAAVHLNGFDDADIGTRVAALSAEDRAALRAGCPEWASRVRSAILDAGWRAAVAAGRWAEAAGHLNGFNDSDITARVTALPHASRVLLYQASPARITAVIATVDLAAAYEGAVAAHDWPKAAVHLNGFNDPDIATRVAALSAADLAALRAGCPEWASRVRSAILDVLWRAAVAAGRWAEAAGHLNGFNDSDITARVTALPHASRVLLYQASPARITAVIATVDLAAAYEGAVAAHDWPKAAVHLNGFNDPDIATRVVALSAADLAALRAGCPEWASRVRSAILDVLWRAAVVAGRWAEAAGHLNGFNDSDITARVTALPHASRVLLYQASPARITAVIATVDLAAAYEGAVAAHDWAKAAVHLNGFNDADIATRVAALSAADRAAMLAAAPAWATRVRVPLIGVPTETYLVPFDHAPLAAAGERIIFRGEFRSSDPQPVQVGLFRGWRWLRRGGGPGDQDGERTPIRQRLLQHRLRLDRHHGDQRPVADPADRRHRGEDGDVELREQGHPADNHDADRDGRGTAVAQRLPLSARPGHRPARLTGLRASNDPGALRRADLQHRGERPQARVRHDARADQCGRGHGPLLRHRQRQRHLHRRCHGPGRGPAQRRNA